MLKLSRYFSIANFFAIVAVVAALSMYYRSISTDALIAHQTHSNVSLAKAFVNSVWPRHADFVKSASNIPKAELPQRDEIDSLRKDVLFQMESLNVVKVKIYNLNGLTVFSTDAKQIGVDKSDNTGFQKALGGDIASSITFRNEFYAFEQVIVDRNLVISYIPVREADGTVEAVIELYSDVTDLVDDLNRTQTQIILMVSITLGLLYLFQYVIVKRADKTISTQNLERKRAEQRLRERTQRLEALIRTNARVAATIEPNETLNAIAKEAANLLRVEGAGFRLLEQNRLLTRGCYGLAHTVMITPSIAVGESLTGRVAQQRKAIAIADIRMQQDFKNKHRQAAIAHGVVAYLGVPMVYDGQLIGVLNVYGKQQHTFLEEEVGLLQAFADQATIAIAKARHAEELEKQVIERKRVQDALVDKTKELERSNKELNQFAYVTSHDLKAPLRAITNLSEWIEEDLGDDVGEDVSKQMDMLRRRVRRMEDLIDGILQYSRVGRNAVDLETVDTAAMLQETVDSLSVPPAFTIAVSENMPTFRLARVRLAQVFSNLIGNAIKYHDRTDGRVQVSARDAGKFYEFSIADDGPGISPQYHDKVFMIFQTLAPRDQVESTGIGLTIVKKIVEDQGGSIALESDVGRGTTFRLTWPKQPKEHSQHEG